jgi:hypothetical protein
MSDGEGNEIADDDAAGETNLQRPRFLRALSASMVTLILVANEVIILTEIPQE